MDGEDGGGVAERSHIIEVDKPGGARRPRRCSLLRHVSVEAVVGEWETGSDRSPPVTRKVRVGVRSTVRQRQVVQIKRARRSKD